MTQTVLGAAGRTTFQARLEHAYPIGALNKALLDLLPVQPPPRVAANSEELLTLGQHWMGDWRLSFDNLRTKSGAAGKLGGLRTSLQCRVLASLEPHVPGQYFFPQPGEFPAAFKRIDEGQVVEYEGGPRKST